MVFLNSLLELCSVVQVFLVRSWLSVTRYLWDSYFDRNKVEEHSGGDCTRQVMHSIFGNLIAGMFIVAFMEETKAEYEKGFEEMRQKKATVCTNNL